MEHSARDPERVSDRTGADAVGAESGSRVVDVHAHIVPDGVVDALRTKGRRSGIEILDTAAGPAFSIGGRLTPPLPAALTSSGLYPEDLRAIAMAGAGVTAQVLSPWMEMTATGLGRTHERWYCDLVNEAMVGAVAASLGRFAGLGMVPLTDPDGAARTLGGCLDQGLAGVEIATSLPGLDLADHSLDSFWQVASDRRAMILLHPFRPYGGVQGDRMGDIVGNPAETAVAMGRLLFAGLLDRWPDLRLVTVHGGGVLPYLAGRLSTLAELDDHPGRGVKVLEGLRRLYFDSLTHSPQILAWLLEFAGASRILLGSDFPFPTGCADPVAQLTAIPDLEPSVRAAVLRMNADRLLSEVRH